MSQINSPSTLPTSRRLGPTLLAAALLVAATLGASSCDLISRDWHWTMGKTHGLIIETTAVRASLGIYHAPTRGIYDVYRGGGIHAAESIIWHFGEPPSIKKSFTIRGHRFTISFGPFTTAAKVAVHDVIFHREGDLSDAIRNAHAHDNCLAVTLLSGGKPVINWTNKSVGCREGKI